MLRKRYLLIQIVCIYFCAFVFLFLALHDYTPHISQDIPSSLGRKHQRCEARLILESKAKHVK